MNRRKWSGYTLVEMLIVLGVILSIMSIPVFIFRKWERETKAVAFFNQFEVYYHRTQLSAITSFMGTAVSIQKEYILFIFQSSQKNRRMVTLELPENVIWVKGDKQIYFNANTGNPRELKTIGFLNDDTGEVTTYTMQMGSGKLEKNIEKK